MNVASFDPILIGSVILMQIGARHLELDLTPFQRQLLKNKIIQAIILFGIVYIPVRDLKKTLLILILIYLIIYVFFNENNNYNLFSKKFLFTNGIIKDYEDIKKKYYMNLSKII
jgi:hypothetical protein